MKKRNLVVANWKMHPATLEEAKKIFSFSRNTAKSLKNVEVVICPPFPYLQPLSKLDHPKNLVWGVQNISLDSKGSHTGEVSAEMIVNLGAAYCIVGHSERRALGETDEIVSRKLQTAFDSSLTPILCIGEKHRDRDASYLEFIKNQLRDSLKFVQRKNLVGLLIAYEPVWAIGKSYREAPGPNDVYEMTIYIKKAAGELFGLEIADSLKFLYGGSVETGNDNAMIEKGNVLGFLVGHASLDPQQFPAILKAADFKK